MFKRAIKFLITRYKKTRWSEMKELKKRQYETMICKEFFYGIPLPDGVGGPPEGYSQASASESLGKLPEPVVTWGRKQTVKPKDDPLSQYLEKLRKFVINPNTINAKYIRFVFQSKQFKEYFEDFMSNQFVSDY